jgi:hypothetical protein
VIRSVPTVIVVPVVAAIDVAGFPAALLLLRASFLLPAFLLPLLVCLLLLASLLLLVAPLLLLSLLMLASMPLWHIAAVAGVPDVAVASAVAGVLDVSGILLFLFCQNQHDCTMYI